MKRKKNKRKEKCKEINNLYFNKPRQVGIGWTQIMSKILN